MNRRLSLLRISAVWLLSATVVWGTSIQTPRAGTVHSANGSVYPLLGLSRSLIAGPPLLSGVGAAAFGNRAGIAAVAGGLEILDLSGTLVSHWDVDSHNAVLGIDDASGTALAWLPDSNSIVLFAAGDWRTTPVAAPLPGTVMSVRRASADTVHLLLSEGEQVFELTVGVASGNVLLQRLIPEAKAPAAYFADGLLYQQQDVLVYESASAGQKTLRFNGHIGGFEQMSGQAVHAMGSGFDAQWMVELTRAGGLAVSQLPAPAISLAGGAR